MRLSDYEPKSIAVAFERRMKKEKDSQLKLLLAEIAAENGGVEGRKFIESLADTVDYAIVNSRADALGRLLRLPHPPEWVFDAVHATLNDTREVTNVIFQGSFNRQIRYIAEEEANLTYALGKNKNPKSVPLLIEMARQRDSEIGAVTALGMIGDARGIPVCLELLNRDIVAMRDLRTPMSEPSQHLVDALANLHADTAVPTLLEYLHSPTVIAALGKMGDERAIEPLKKIVADRGNIDHHPDARADTAQERFVTARIGLIRLEKSDPVPRLLEMMKDPSLTKYQLSNVIDELSLHADPRAIDPLLELVKSNPSRVACRSAISALSKNHYKKVAAGLIDCLDLPLTVPPNGLDILDGNPFEEIAAALHALTGVDFGTDKVRWKKWWDDDGKNLPGLQ